MKKKILIICAVLAAVISVMAMAAILLPKSVSDTDEPEDTTADTVDDGMITFMWDSVEYTVAEGTTFQQFIVDNADSEGLFHTDLSIYEVDPDGTIYCGNGVTNMQIPSDGIIQDGQAYGINCRVAFTLAETNIICYNGVTWRALVASGAVEYTISTLDGFDYIFYGATYVVNVETGEPVEADDLIITGTYNY